MLALGATFRYYEGSLPVLCVSDVNLLQEILIKQFHNFYSRKDLPLIPDPDTFDQTNMFIARGGRWKRLRSICNPTFSATKMKQMKPLMEKCVQTLCKVLSQKCDENLPFNLYEYVQGLTLDVIAETAFGVETQVQSNPQQDEFLVACNKFFKAIDFTANGHAMLVASMIFPEARGVLARIHYGMDVVRTRGDAILDGYAKMVIKNRKHDPETKRFDVLQMMLEAESKTLLSKQELQDPDMRFMTEDELVSQTILFLVAGFETTSTTLAYMLYLLAMYPDVQEKLHAEVDSYVQTTKECPTYETLNQMKYLEMAINETLRMYPVGATVQSRKVMNKCTLGDNIRLPAGAAIQIDVWSLHHDPDIWGPVDPHIFDPERFLEHDKRNPCSFIPFGEGPKNCVGKRFALLEIKLAMTAIVKRFKIYKCSETESPLSLKESATVTPKNGVFVKLEKRL